MQKNTKNGQKHKSMAEDCTRKTPVSKKSRISDEISSTATQVL